MPTIVSCPECQKKHRVKDEMLGKRLKCPDCKHIFVAQADDGEEGITAAPAPKKAGPAPKPRRPVPTEEEDEEEETEERQEDETDEEEEDEDEQEEDEDEEEEIIPTKWQPWTREEKVTWRTVRKGVSFVYYGMRTSLTVVGIWVVGDIVLVLLSVTSNQSADSSKFYALLAAAFITLTAILVGGLLTGLTLHTIGHVLFLSTPDRPGTKLRVLGLSAASIWFVSLFFILSGGGGCGLLAFTGMALIAGPAFSAGGFVFLLPWFFAFWMYMREIARELRDEQLVRAPFIYMIAFPVYNFVGYGMVLVLHFVMMAVLELSSDFQEALARAVLGMLIVLMAWLVFLVIDFALLIWGMSILQRIIASIDSRLGPRT
jgi:predicted Zn finger-like uncharacterized protein